MMPLESDLLQSWFGFLGTFCFVVHFRILLWWVLLARGIGLVHRIENRSARCTLLCIGRYLCASFLLPQAPLLVNKSLSLEM